MIVKMRDGGFTQRENIPEIIIIIIVIYHTDRQIWEGKGMRIAPLAVLGSPAQPFSRSE